LILQIEVKILLIIVLQADAKKKGFPWELSKGQDNFCPIS
jgi:hypothetical protein